MNPKTLLEPLPPEPRLQRFQKRTEWPLATVAILFLAAYSVQVLAQPVGGTATAIEHGMQITWGLFLLDYLARLILARNRTRWFFHHLVDLAVVALPLLRPLRLLRLVVLITALQKAIGGAIRGRIVIYTASGAVLLIYAASLAVLETERSQPGSKITTFGDAVWWSLETVTTVGYGDVPPMTGKARLIAVALMIGGISLVGLVTASLTSWIVERVTQEDTARQAATAAHIEALGTNVQRQIDALRSDIQLLTKTVTAHQSPEKPHEGNGLDSDRIGCAKNLSLG